MKLVLQDAKNVTLDRPIAGISVDDEGSLLVLKYKGLHDSDVCADLVDEDTKMQNELLHDETTRNQLKRIRSFTSEVLVKHLSSWNVPGLEVNKKNIDAVLKDQTAMWDIRNDLMDLVTESAHGIPRSQKADEVKNLLSLAGRGSS